LADLFKQPRLPKTAQNLKLESVLVLALFLQSLNLHLPQQISQIDVYFPGCTESQFEKSTEEDADSNFVKKVPKQEQTLGRM